MKRAATEHPTEDQKPKDKKPASQLAVVRATMRAEQQERLAAKLKHIKENPRVGVLPTTENQ